MAQQDPVPPPPQPPTRSPIAEFFATLLFGSGVLLLIVCGGCTAFFFIFGPTQGWGLFPAALLIGAPGIGLGWLFFWLGKRWLRKG